MYLKRWTVIPNIGSIRVSDSIMSEKAVTNCSGVHYGHSGMLPLFLFYVLQGNC